MFVFGMCSGVCVSCFEEELSPPVLEVAEAPCETTFTIGATDETQGIDRMKLRLIALLTTTSFSALHLHGGNHYLGESQRTQEVDGHQGEAACFGDGNGRVRVLVGDLSSN